MKVISIASALTLGVLAMPVEADPSPQSDPNIPPVCEEMPDRQGHFWDQSDWCRWMREFENNRDRNDRVKEQQGK